MNDNNFSNKALEYNSSAESIKNKCREINKICSGAASNSFMLLQEKIFSEMDTINKNIETFSIVLPDMDKLKKLKLEINTLTAQIKNINIYVYNQKTGKNETNQEKINLQNKLKVNKQNKEKEYNELKKKIIDNLATIDNNTETTNTPTINSNELSYNDAIIIANKLDVPVDYILSLHLHEGYKLGDKIIPDGITPDMIHYAGAHGYPIIIDGIEDKGSEYFVEGRGKKLYKSTSTFTSVRGGEEYNITWQPIAFEEMEGRNVYWTWYGPKSQGKVLNRDFAPIQCTNTLLYPCDDQLYRDKDGYIVIAGSPYKNQFYDGIHVNYDAHGGLAEEDLYGLTPFGIGKFYDNGAALVENGIESDLYRNDGYESNGIAKTEYGRRLRGSAVEGYETLNLYWNNMIH